MSGYPHQQQQQPYQQQAYSSSSSSSSSSQVPPPPAVLAGGPASQRYSTQQIASASAAADPGLGSGSGYFAGNNSSSSSGSSNSNVMIPARRPGSQSSGSGSSGGHASSSQEIMGGPGAGIAAAAAAAGNGQYLLSPGNRSSSFMGSPGNTVGLDMTSAAIARGEVGANYSRYSTGNIAALAGGGGGGSGSPGSSGFLGGGGAAPGSPGLGSHRYSIQGDRMMTPNRESQIEMDSMPTLYATGQQHSSSFNTTAAPLSPQSTPGYGKSRFSEYGLAASASIDNSSSESPSFRDSTLFDRRESMQFGPPGGGKEMEDTSLLWNEKNIEADDFLHDPRTLQTAKSDRFWNFPTSFRGIANAAGICVLLGGLLALFMGWPIHTYVTGVSRGGTTFGWNMGGTNASGQIPDIPNLPSLIDADTPDDIKTQTRTGFNGKQYQLVFSDEFNVDGRTFFPGDDPYWEAVDIHYWQTRDLEWYDPDAATTKDGKLQITLSEQPIHGLNFRSGMLQTWNKLCFNGGAFFEVSVSLPGNPQASGFWPGLWTMGNLGRAGYGATNDGMWPYSYGSCDVGTLPHQMFPDKTPAAAMDSGETDYNGQLSILAGQRASACTCKGQPHPGPKNNVGRGAPEIDILEAQVDWRGYGTASQSIQIAPFDYRWNWNNMTSDGLEIYNSSMTTLNLWKGAATQESASAVSIMQDCYEEERYETFGYEYTPGGGPDSQITWSIGGKPTWTLKAGAFPPDSRTEVGQRLISEEPMYMIMNLALSPAFQALQFNKLQFPGTFYIDYVRVWQEKGKTDITCDPDSHPTADYINEYMEYYTNPNITTWPSELWPKNSLVDNC